MKIKRNIHDQFHLKSNLQKRIIDNKNFTYRNIIKLLEELKLDKSKEVLDIGCGVGTIDFYLSRRVKKITGIDISKKAISIARKNAKFLGIRNVKFYNSEINDLKKSSKFDIIICSETIEHIKDDSTFLYNIQNHLNKDGLVFLTTPLISAPLYKIGLTKNFDTRVGHLRRYNLNQLKKIVRTNKLKIKSIYKQEGIFRNTLFVFGIFNQLIRLANKFTLFSDTFTTLDNLSERIFGPSNICLILNKTSNKKNTVRRKN